MTSNVSSAIKQTRLPLRVNWQQRRLTTQFQDDPLRNLAMSNHALSECYSLLINRHLLDLETLLRELQTKTRADFMVYRNFGASLSKRAITEEDRQFVRTFYDGPLQVLSNFSLGLEVCLLFLSRRQLGQLEEELPQLQRTMQENIADCYRWVRETNGFT